MINRLFCEASKARTPLYTSNWIYLNNYEITKNTKSA